MISNTLPLNFTSEQTAVTAVKTKVVCKSRAIRKWTSQDTNIIDPSLINTTNNDRDQLAAASVFLMAYATLMRKHGPPGQASQWPVMWAQSWYSNLMQPPCADLPPGPLRDQYGSYSSSCVLCGSAKASCLPRRLGRLSSNARRRCCSPMRLSEATSKNHGDPRSTVWRFRAQLRANWAPATAQGILAKMLQWKKTRAAAMLVMSPRQSKVDFLASCWTNHLAS